MHNQKGEPEEKGCDFQKGLSTPKSAYGFASKTLLLHISTTPHSSSRSTTVSEPPTPNGKTWLPLDSTVPEKGDITGRCQCAVSLGGCQSSCPRLGEQHLVSVAGICYKLLKRLPESATAVSNSLHSQKNYTASRSHAETEGFTQARRLEMLCLDYFLPSQVCSGIPRAWDRVITSILWQQCTSKVLLHHSSSYLIKNPFLKLRHCHLRQL